MAKNDTIYDTIKPCPFCGDIPEEVEWDDDEGLKHTAAIRCSNIVCCASGPVSGWYRVPGDALSYAIKLWNRRMML